MQGLVDVVRLSPQGTDTFAMLDAFRANGKWRCTTAVDGEQRL